MSGNVYLEISLPFGTSLTWHDNAISARCSLLDTMRRMGCTRVGDGRNGSLMRDGSVVATFTIGTDSDIDNMSVEELRQLQVQRRQHHERILAKQFNNK